MAVVNITRTQVYDVYIGRGRDPFGDKEMGRWGNPFVIGRDGNREEVVAKHRRWLWEQINTGAISLSDLAALDGKTLGCFCAPSACHGHTLEAAAAWASKHP
jgi:uncharacterized protein DUF4326